MRIAVCDDCIEFVNEIENYIEKTRYKNIDYDVYYNGEDLVQAYDNNLADYDAIFLDMEMGELNGIETAAQIRMVDEKVIIVFITSHTKYMQESFKCQPFRFIVKPILFDDFMKVYEEVELKICNSKETLVFSENKTRKRVYCSDVLFIESLAHWVLIYMNDGAVHKVRKTMYEVSGKVSESSFARVHRSYLVNVDYIYQISENEVRLHDYSFPIPLSKTYKAELKEKFLNFKERKYLL